ncbi:hypothetical protein ACLOJK_039436 [Asimina triloba]
MGDLRNLAVCGLLMETPSVSFANSKSIKMQSTVIHVLTQKAWNLFLAPSVLRVCAMCGKQVIDTKFYKQSNLFIFIHWNKLVQDASTRMGRRPKRDAALPTAIPNFIIWVVLQCCR